MRIFGAILIAVAALICITLWALTGAEGNSPLLIVGKEVGIYE